MSNPLESAYFSAVMLANGLTQLSHAKTEQAVRLKDLLARAITHPDILRDDEFTGPWEQRSQFANLNLPGDVGELVAKHANILTETTLD